MYKAYIKRGIFACIIDYSIVYTLMYLILVNYGEPTANGYQGKGFIGLLPILMWGLFTVGLEQITGATLGNRLVGLKALDAGLKTKPKIIQSFKRHLLDPVDMFFLVWLLLL